MCGAEVCGEFLAGGGDLADDDDLLLLWRFRRRTIRGSGAGLGFQGLDDGEPDGTAAEDEDGGGGVVLREGGGEGGDLDGVPAYC